MFRKVLHSLDIIISSNMLEMFPLKMKAIEKIDDFYIFQHIIHIDKNSSIFHRSSLLKKFRFFKVTAHPEFESRISPPNVFFKLENECRWGVEWHFVWENSAHWRTIQYFDDSEHFARSSRTLSSLLRITKKPVYFFCIQLIVTNMAQQLCASTDEERNPMASRNIYTPLNFLQFFLLTELYLQKTPTFVTYFCP